MRILAATTLLVAALLTGCDQAPGEPRVTVEDARVQLPAVEGRPGVAYFALDANRRVRLVGVTSPRIGRIELHETREEDGVSRMMPMQDPGFEGSLRFEPGGRHAMLFDVDAALRAGSRVPLIFAFDGAPPVTAEAEVVAPGQGGHGGH